ncbi:hypothetical protein ERJ75_000832600 [Trypanosoma vivax]|uniref:Uncharacterized protein n=1 Tax=Trypanosoma vivax (strain Y486) TaxID=1055687 RepID=G0TYZ6_TRYVY|nr:hypothetical protein TRVL_00136 [Trypanosoma vivax]KAH8613039.1 hypothetical protein ERJ75_000832600 [Trypanosoma vivax]CCC49199.1 conserved hypothetical protein [Trypanosoma vivax Y486]
MENLSVIHTFEGDSTFLVEVHPSLLHRPIAVVEESVLDTTSSVCGHNTENSFSAFTSAVFPLEITNGRDCTDNGENELSVMRVVSMSGTEDFHRRFLAGCEAYCRLCQRLQRAAEWLMLNVQDRRQNCGGHASTIDNTVFDVDCLTRVTHPVEPTAFLAAAFALPALVSVAPALSEDGVGGKKRDGDDSLSSTVAKRVVPYCLFYSCPEKRLLCGGRGEASPADRLGMTVLERFSAVSKAIGLCGVASRVYSAPNLRTQVRAGLTLQAYVEGCLPSSVINISAGPREASVAAKLDPFSSWSDDILWRLLSSLVSALAVVHAGGFHYCGELSLNDVLCFSIPGDNDPSVADVEALLSGRSQEDFNDVSLASAGSVSWNPIGKRFAAWAATSERQWAITESTPAHHAFFMFAIPPRSLFLTDDTPVVSVTEAQKRDTAALGHLIIRVIEETKRRRGSPGSGGCSELLFVAERMLSLDERGTNHSGAAATSSAAQVHRFAQLQVIRLRTHLWLLRTVVEERNAQLVAALRVSAERKRNNNDSDNSNDIGPRDCGATNNDAFSLISFSRGSAVDEREQKLRERERAVAEREEKLNQFLVLYELTAERLDQISMGKDGFENLKRSLLQLSKNKAKVGADRSSGAALRASLSPRDSARDRSVGPSWFTHSKGTAQKPARRTHSKDIQSAEQRRTANVTGRVSKASDRVSVAASTSSVAGFLGKGRRAGDVSPGPRARNTSELPQGCSGTQAAGLSSGNVGGRNSPLSPKEVDKAFFSSSAGSGKQYSGVMRSRNYASATTCNRPAARSSTPVGAPTTPLAKAKANGQSSTTRSPVPRSTPPTASVYPSGARPRTAPTIGPRRNSPAGVASVHSPSRDAFALSRKLPAGGAVSSPSAKRPPLQLHDAAPNTAQGNKLTSLPEATGTILTVALSADSSNAGSDLSTHHSPSDQSPLARKVCGSPCPASSETSRRSTQLGSCGSPVFSKIQRQGTELGCGNIGTSSPDGPRRSTGERAARQPSMLSGHSISVPTAVALDSVDRAPVPGTTKQSPSNRAATTDDASSLSSSREKPFVPAINSLVKSLASGKSVIDLQQSLASVRNSQKQEKDNSTTPRSMRLRLDDGWVDNHLAALEQMRFDFHQFEVAKSARNASSSVRNSMESYKSLAAADPQPEL